MDRYKSNIFRQQKKQQKSSKERQTLPDKSGYVKPKTLRVLQQERPQI